MRGSSANASRMASQMLCSVPLRLRSDKRPVPRLLAVRGEALMYLSDFESLNQSRMEAGDEPYQNPRNATSGRRRNSWTAATNRGGAARAKSMKTNARRVSTPTNATGARR